MNRHDQEQLFSRMDCGGRFAPRLHPILAASRCYGTFGSGDKIQTALDQQAGADTSGDDSFAASVNAGTQSNAAGHDQIQSAYGSNLAAQGGVLLQNSVFKGTDNSNNTGTITHGYDAGQFQTALQTVGTNISQAVAAQSQAGQATLDRVLGELSGLAESQQTGGESGKNQIVLYVVLAGLAVFAFIFYKK